MYNPMQSRLDQLNQQKQMIEQQMQMLQGYQMPPININNQITPTPNAMAYDFGCKWINDDNEAKNLPNNVIGFYKNEPIFVMSGKKFRFSEVAEEVTPQVDEKYNALERQIQAITERLDKLSINTQVIQEKPTEATKPTKKGGIANE